MRAVRLTTIDLAYGCHHGRFELPDQSTPIVILGPNGAGKTTLMEALVLTLYGFNPRKEPTWMATRSPWDGETFKAIVVLTDESGTSLGIERDFRTQEVAVWRVSDGAEIFRGVADPDGVDPVSSQYRGWLATHLGLERRDQYESTANLRQGELTRTRLGDHLLVLAAGGHRDVATALAELEGGYHGLTQEPLAEDESRGTDARELELAEQGIEALEHRLADERTAQERGKPIAAELASVRQTLVELERDIRQLDDALPLLSERRAVKAERDALSARIAWLDALERELSNAVVRLESTVEAAAALGTSAGFPDDFQERVAVLEELWAQRAVLERQQARLQTALQQRRVPAIVPWTTILTALVLVGAGANLIFSGSVAAGGTLALLGAVTIAMVVWWQGRVRQDHAAASDALRRATAEVRVLDGKISDKLKHVPEGSTLRPESLPDRRLRFEAKQKGERAEGDARHRLAELLSQAREELDADRVRGTLQTAGETDNPLGPDPTPDPDTPLPVLIEGGMAMRERLRRLGNRARGTLVAKEIEVRQVFASPLALPADIPSEAEAVEHALAGRVADRTRTEQRIETLERRLVEEGRATVNPLTLELDLASRRARWAEVSRNVEIHRQALELVQAAYQAFRIGDQDRLLGCISMQLDRLTDGLLGPLSAETLETLAVNVKDRRVPLESPPLSYGEFHAVLLAIRLGMADFLARAGVRPPFLVDDPFTHLDEERAAAVWRLLCAVAQDRQVIVATQDRLMVEALGVTPDITLGREAAGAVQTDPLPVSDA